MSLTLVKIKLSHLWLSVSRGTDGNICLVSFLTTHASQGGLRYYNSHTSFYDDVHANKQKFATPLVENILAHLWLSVSRGTDGNIRFVSFLTTRFSGRRCVILMNGNERHFRFRKKKESIAVARWGNSKS